MNSKVMMIIRILLGLFVLFFGLNKFFEFVQPGGEMSEEMINYFGALTATKTLTMVAIVEIVAGLALIFNKFGALMAVILMSVSVNATLFHATLDMANIGPAAGMLVLNIIVLYGYREKYRDMLSG